MYLAILIVAFMYVSVGLDKNWLNLQIKKLISRLKCVRYKIFPIKLLKLVGPESCLSESQISLCPGSMVHLVAKSTTSWRRPRLYFLWQRDMPWKGLTTPNPKKYLRLSISFILNFTSNKNFKLKNSKK